MSDTGRIARGLISGAAKLLNAEFKGLPWYAWRRRAEIVGAMKALLLVHGQVCDMLMEEHAKAASTRHPIQEP